MWRASHSLTATTGTEDRGEGGVCLLHNAERQTEQSCRSWGGVEQGGGGVWHGTVPCPSR